MKLFLAALCLLFTLPSYSQIIATTEGGRKVILNKNGTWKYLEEKKGNIKKDTIVEIPPLGVNPLDETGIVTADCAKVVSVETDKFTGKTSVAGKNYIIIPSKHDPKAGIKILNVLVGERNDVLVCNITAVGSVTCVDRGDKVYFICTDGTKFNIGHSSKFNCRGDFSLYLGGVFGNEEELGYLSTKKISAIRVQTDRNLQDVELSNEQSNKLLNEISCLLKYKN